MYTTLFGINCARWHRGQFFIEGKKLTTFVVTVCHTRSFRIQPYFYAVCRRPSGENVKRDWGCVCVGTEKIWSDLCLCWKYTNTICLFGHNYNICLVLRGFLGFFLSFLNILVQHLDYWQEKSNTWI